MFVFYSISSIDSPCNKMRISLFFLFSFDFDRRSKSPSKSSIIRKIVVYFVRKKIKLKNRNSV